MSSLGLSRIMKKIQEKISNSTSLSSVAILAVVTTVGLGLLAFSQTAAYYGDEGWNLLACQLVKDGRLPYLDFFYQHPPFYIYLTAGWMSLFGESWRSVHIMSSLLLSGSILLVSIFVHSRLREPILGTAATISAALFMGLNVLVIEFGTIAQPYALCLFSTVASFLIVTTAVQRGGWTPFWGGVCSGVAAASSLLTAPVGLVLVFWIARHSRKNERWAGSVKFLGGAVLPFLPVLIIGLKKPRAVFFNLVEFHLKHRELGGLVKGNITLQNLKVLTSWLDSVQGLMLVFLAGLGLLFLTGRNGLDERSKSEFRLCASIAFALALYLAIPRPTFPQYFIIITPFLTIIASLGVYAIVLRLWASKRSYWLVLCLCGLFAFAPTKWLYKHREAFSKSSGWREIEEVARELNRVTPKNGVIYTDEKGIYFVAGRKPPTGLESAYAPYAVPPELAEDLKVMPKREIEERFETGNFAAAAVWDAKEYGIDRFFAKRKRFRNFQLFWERITSGCQTYKRNDE